MLHVELVPDLYHCIETVARREYENTLKKLLGIEETNEELEERLQILRLFLQTVAFKKLRMESEQHLLIGRKVRFIVYLRGCALKYDMEVEDS